MLAPDPARSETECAIVFQAHERPCQTGGLFQSDHAKIASASTG